MPKKSAGRAKSPPRKKKQRKVRSDKGKKRGPRKAKKASPKRADQSKFLSRKKIGELKDIARSEGVKGFSKYRNRDEDKRELRNKIRAHRRKSKSRAAGASVVAARKRAAKKHSARKSPSPSRRAKKCKYGRRADGRCKTLRDLRADCKKQGKILDSSTKQCRERKRRAAASKKRKLDLARLFSAGGGVPEGLQAPLLPMSPKRSRASKGKKAEAYFLPFDTPKPPRTKKAEAYFLPFGTPKPLASPPRRFSRGKKTKRRPPVPPKPAGLVPRGWRPPAGPGSDPFAGLTPKSV